MHCSEVPLYPIFPSLVLTSQQPQTLCKENPTGYLNQDCEDADDMPVLGSFLNSSSTNLCLLLD